MKSIGLALVFGFVTLTALEANAGEGFRTSVFTYSVGAYGTVSGARYSSDNVQYIGCYTRNNNSGACFATDSSGNYKTCYTTDPSTVQMMLSTGPLSYISFTFDSNGNCNYLFIENASWAL